MTDNIIQKLLQVVNAAPSDANAGYLSEKLVAGTDITISVENVPGNPGAKRLRIDAGGTPAVAQYTIDSNDNANGTGTAGPDPFAGVFNVAIGDSALNNYNTVGATFSRSIAIGLRALEFLEASNGNIAIGTDALGSMGDSSGDNVAIGSDAGINGGDGLEANVFLGAQSDVFDDLFDYIYSTALGSFSQITADDQIKMGDEFATVFISGFLQINEVEQDSTPMMGVATLVAGKVTVDHDAVQDNSRILLTVQSVGGSQGMISVGTRVADTSFDIDSSNAADTSTIMWMLIKPGDTYDPDYDPTP